MLKIDPRHVEAVRAAQDKTDLYPALQSAIELEHSTIPPYLTAWYSLEPGLNDEIGRLLRSVVVEEMLHMTLAANVLVALGGAPSIDGEDFVPHYPGPLPMGIGGDGFIVHIAPFSLPLVRDTFMVIEEPEHPIEIGTLMATAPTYRTIGEFYTALKEKIVELPASDFGHVDRQVPWPMGPLPGVLPIVDAASAGRAIDLIIRQGEGTNTDPFESPGEPSHYYRFGEIYNGSRLIRTKDGFSYGGEPIAFVSDGVYAMKPDPHPEQFAPGTYGRLLSDNFTAGYTALLTCLHAAFNGEPKRIDAAMGLMYQLRFMAQKLMSTPLTAGGLATGGPVYRFARMG